MADLSLALRETIRHLEKLRNRQAPTHPELPGQITDLYEQLVGLINASINGGSAEYEAAASAMEEAAGMAEKALAGLANTDIAVERAANAIRATATLLAAVAP